MEGLENEFTLELQRSQDARDNFFKILTYNNYFTSENALKYINDICKKSTNRAGASAYEKNGNNSIHQIHSTNSPPIEEQDHHDSLVYNEQSC